MDSVHDSGQPFKFCKVADFADWQDSEFEATRSLLKIYGKNRKAWEFIQVYNGLHRLGVLNGRSRAIGLGVGHECLIYAFTNVCDHVIATDLYNSENWSTAAMSAEEVYQRNPFPFQPDKLTVQHMDMTQIEYPDASFDFVWSCCSIEHVSSFEDLHKVYAEIHRVLKPGGIAALTTEYNPTDRHSYEPHMLFTDRHWIHHWLTGENPLVQGFELLDEIDDFITPIPENEPISRSDPRSSIQVLSKDIILNSISFFMRKAGEFSQPYHDQWLSPDWRTYLKGCNALNSDQLDEAQALFQSLLENPDLDLRLRVATSRRLGTLLMQQGQTDEVVRICKQVFPYCQFAEDEDHLVPLARVFRQANLLDEAHAIYQRAETLPGATINQVIRCITYQAKYFAQKGDVQTALKLMEKAFQQTSGSKKVEDLHKVYFHLGLYHEKLGHISEAIAHYQQAIELSEPETKFHNNCQLRLENCLNGKAKVERQEPKSDQFFSKFKSFVKTLVKG